MGSNFTTTEAAVYKIENFTDPQIFFALRKISLFLLEEWETWFMSDDITEAEYNLAIVKSKTYKDEIVKLSKLDSDLCWGEEKIKTGDKKWHTVSTGDFNPWYQGELQLADLLNSIEDLIEFTDYSTKPDNASEFVHYYYFLNSKLPNSRPNPIAITLESLHPKIQKASKSLFRDKHYSQAIFEAYKAVLKEVKDVSGVRHFSDKPLVEKVFSLNEPIIKLNNLDTDYAEDEQKGFMLLFMGAALGIRNPKAHDLVIQKDPLRTLEYLSFASLLITRLDERIKPKK